MLLASMGERKQINLLVDESQKDRWDAYVENTAEVSSLSHLIRLSVERQLSDSDDDSRTMGETTAVSERIDSLEATIEDLAGDVRTLLREQEGEQLNSLASEIYDYVESVEDEETFFGYDEFTRDTHYAHIEQLCNLLNKDEFRIRKGIERLQQSFARVAVLQADGQEYVVEVE